MNFGIWGGGGGGCSENIVLIKLIWIRFFSWGGGSLKKCDYFYGFYFNKKCILMKILHIFLGVIEITGILVDYQSRYFVGTELMLGPSLCIRKSSEYPLPHLGVSPCILHF